MTSFCDSVIAIIRQYGWCKRSMLDAKGSSCLLGAIGRAAGVVTDGSKPGPDLYNKIANWMRMNPAIDRAMRAVCAEARTCGFDLLDNVIWYNDHRCNSEADVILFVEKVKARMA